jgi:uncharacterized membrane protein
MGIYIAGLVIFFGAHLFPAFAWGRREAMVGRLGVGPYKGLFALVTLIGFVLIVLGWRQASAEVIWTAPDWWRTVNFLLMPFATIAIAAAYLPAGRIAGALKHPMLVAVKIWAFVHLVGNGDVRSILLFGSFLAYAVVDRIAVKKRGDHGRAAGPVRNDVIAIVVGLVIYAAIVMWLHPYLSGIDLTP